MAHFKYLGLPQELRDYILGLLITAGSLAIMRTNNEISRQVKAVSEKKKNQYPTYRIYINFRDAAGNRVTKLENPPTKDVLARIQFIYIRWQLPGVGNSPATLVIDWDRIVRHQHCRISLEYTDRNLSRKNLYLTKEHYDVLRDLTAFEKIEVWLVPRCPTMILSRSDIEIVEVLLERLRRELECGLGEADERVCGDDHCLVFRPWKNTDPLVDANEGIPPLGSDTFGSAGEEVLGRNWLCHYGPLIIYVYQ